MACEHCLEESHGDVALHSRPEDPIVLTQPSTGSAIALSIAEAKWLRQRLSIGILNATRRV